MSRPLIILLLFISVNINARADSPLTSTPFSSAYSGLSIMKQAAKAQGMLNEVLMDYLIADNPLDVKMAIINKLGWSIGGNSNADVFIKYLIKSQGYKNSQDILRRGRADEILCVAYLKAMDDYFNVKEANHWALRAVKLNPGSYTCQLIAALIKAQLVFDSNWCEVFLTSDRVRNNSLLTMDMRPEAVDIIFAYMDLYRDACEQE